MNKLRKIIIGIFLIIPVIIIESILKAGWFIIFTIFYPALKHSYLVKEFAMEWVCITGYPITEKLTNIYE